ncbi:hypothetical protein D3C77_762440 [compost metagenome]
MFHVGGRAVGQSGAVFRTGRSLCSQFGAEFADFLIQLQDLFVLQGLPVGLELCGAKHTGFVVLIPVTRLLQGRQAAL